MNYCLIGPSKSGKSTIALAIAKQLKLTIVDTGQIVRLTADAQELKDLAEGKLSIRGEKGSGWVNDIVDRAIEQYKDNILFVGYPRSLDQFGHMLKLGGPTGYDHNMKLIMHLASRQVREDRVRGRPDDAGIGQKDNDFYELLTNIHVRVDLFLTTEMTEGTVIHLVSSLPKLDKEPQVV